MPRKSVKRKLIDFLVQDGYVSATLSKNNKILDKRINTSIELITAAQSLRYCTPRNSLTKSSHWFEHVLPNLDDDRFRSQLRVSRTQFDMLLKLFESDHVFVSKTNRQMEIFKQLAISMYKFGHGGSGSSIANVSSKFGVSDGGTVMKVTKRVIEAILNLKSTYVKWPGKEEREFLKSKLAHILPGCIGFVDGTSAVLNEKPSVEVPDDYFSRKHEYGLHVQAICDFDLIIRHYSVGRTASCHDAKVFSGSAVGKRPNDFFSHNEWIGGDAAYKLSDNLVTPFRKNSHEGCEQDRKQFNLAFSRQRIKIEHVFGIMKEKFGSLKDLSVLISGNESHRFACQWIEACIILYNILQSEEDYYFIPDCNDAEDNEIENDECVDACLNLGDIRRNNLVNFMKEINFQY